MLISDAVHIWREPDGDYHVEWRTTHTDTQVQIEAAQPAQSVTATYQPQQSRAKVSGLQAKDRHYFRVSDQYGNEVLAAERRLAMDGSPNFRDFGGYQTADGRRVRWGYLYRSGQLSSLTAEDVDLLGSLQLDLICDFRRVEEQQTEPSRLPAEDPPDIASLPIVPGSNSRFFEEAEGHVGDRQAMYDFMLEINRDFAEAQAPTYRQMFREILAREDARFLVHCAAGKDRTGFAVAVILQALGVPREVVMEDYLLTARFYHPLTQIERLQRKYQMEHLQADAVLPMLEVHEAYLAQAFASIDRRYNSVQEYLREELGVGDPEVAELRRRYLVQP